MVAPNVTQDYYTTGNTTTASFVGFPTNGVKVWDADAVGVLLIHEATGGNDANYKIQVSNKEAQPSAEADWADYVASTTLTNATSKALEYQDLPFRWVRVALSWAVAGEDVTVGISTRRDKVI